MRADEGTSSLAPVKDHPHRKAPSGERGASNNRSGADAKDLEVLVPIGTIVKDENGETIADLKVHGDTFVAAEGGRGGRGNAAFLSQDRRAPRFAELGEPPKHRTLDLEMALIADVAVVGYPNAGKSTLVASLTAARPKVGDYPFTTLEPSLGVIERDDERITVCDVPGLIEGASEGKGLGHKFLRHAERSVIFLHLLDPTSGRALGDDHRILRQEIARYSAEMATRPEVVAINKTDAVDAVEAIVDELSAEGIEVLAISAKTGEGLDELADVLFAKTQEIRSSSAEDEGFRLYRTQPRDRITVSRDGKGWRIVGEAVERWVAMTDMGNPEAVAYLQSRFDRAGVEDALLSAGASPGDDVSIGETTFEWWPPGSAPDDLSELDLS